jgi:hypothetical protein
MVLSTRTSVNSGCGSAWLDRLSEGRLSEPVALLEQAAAALANRALFHYRLGMTYIAAGQLAKASEQLNMALKRLHLMI